MRFLTQVKEDRTPETLVLRLAPRPHIKWGENVVDNEHMNKRSSKSKYLACPQLVDLICLVLTVAYVRTMLCRVLYIPQK